jgi:hypothetical protein
MDLIDNMTYRHDLSADREIDTPFTPPVSSGQQLNQCHSKTFIDLLLGHI